MVNFSALGHTGPPFQYDFGPEKSPQASQVPNQGDIAFTIYADAGTARGGNIASQAGYATSQQIGAGPGVQGAAFGYDAPADGSLRRISPAQISELIVPEPSTIFGGIAAAGLMLAFLVRRLATRMPGCRKLEDTIEKRRSH